MYYLHYRNHVTWRSRLLKRKSVDPWIFASAWNSF